MGSHLGLCFFMLEVEGDTQGHTAGTGQGQPQEGQVGTGTKAGK